MIQKILMGSLIDKYLENSGEYLYLEFKKELQVTLLAISGNRGVKTSPETGRWQVFLFYSLRRSTIGALGTSAGPGRYSQTGKRAEEDPECNFELIFGKGSISCSNIYNVPRHVSNHTRFTLSQPYLLPLRINNRLGKNPSATLILQHTTYHSAASTKNRKKRRHDMYRAAAGDRPREPESRGWVKDDGCWRTQAFGHTQAFPCAFAKLARQVSLSCNDF